MNKLTKRLLTFFIGVPALVFFILVSPYWRHLPVHIIVIVYTGVGAIEFAAMLGKKQMFITKIEAFFFGAVIPIALTLIMSFGFPEWLLPLFFMAAVLWILISRVFSPIEKIDSFAGYVAGSFAALIYPSFFNCWISKMTAWENSGVAILVFFLIPLGSDALAWLTGNLFGKNNRGLFAVSPNKSIAGFIGGFIGSIGIIAIAMLTAPNVFTVRADIPVPLVIFIFGICTGATATLGDLAESALKRSCGVKDSGKLMQGRGGILDTIDSIAVTAPVYYALFNVFFINS